MRQTMETVHTGKEFLYDNVRYVRIPEMIYNIGTEGFVVNCLRLGGCRGSDMPPSIHAEYICDKTIVSVLPDLQVD